MSALLEVEKLEVGFGRTAAVRRSRSHRPDRVRACSANHVGGPDGAARPTWNGAAAPVPGSAGVRPGDVVDGRLYLNVSFAEKDTAKRLVAARWDNNRKLWHVAAETPRERVARWLPGA